MLQSLFRMLVRPEATLDELLEEKRQGRSLGATVLLIVLFVLVYGILILFVGHKLSAQMMADLTGSDSEAAPVAMALFEILFLGAVLIVAVVRFGLSRSVFAWMVQLGVRISAGSQFHRDKEERREKARMLRLIQPYTMWIGLLPSLLSVLALAVMVGFSEVPDVLVVGPDTGGGPSSADVQQVTGLLVELIIWGCLSLLVTLGMSIYMIVVRTIAIQKVYRISGARAFWGPFLAYAILYFLLAVLYVGVMVAAQYYGGSSTSTDLNWM